MLAAQLSCRQPVLLDQGRQEPEPLQVPSLEQSPLATALLLQRDLGSTPPLSTPEHVPAVLVLVALQVLHRPPDVASAHKVLQQTPSVQKPLWHWLALVHAAPFTFKPQELLTHVLGGTQSFDSVAGVQLLLQAEAAQTNVPQDSLAGVTQAPWPSQVEVGVIDTEVAQMAAPQLSPLS